MAWYHLITQKVLPLLDPQFVQWVKAKRYAWQAGRAASDWTWKTAPPCPAPRLDAVSVYHDGRLYVFGGFRHGDEVLEVCDVFDMREERWTDRIPLPDGMGHSHLAIATDGAGYVYAASGQVGPQCRPATRTCFSLDVKTHTWHTLPLLPEARYAATMQWWQGRIHCLGGSKPDRTTPASEHWSLSVDQGHAQEDEWREERPIPRGGCHRASVVINNDLYVFGGQQGDFVAIPDDPDYTCTGELTDEVYCPETFRLSSREGHWEHRADMPIPASHIEAAFLQHGSRVLFFGGQIYKDPVTHRLELTDAIQQYDADTDQWEIVGTLPYRVKNVVVGRHGGWVYVSTGQRDGGPHDASPGRITNHTWRARLPAELR